MEAGWRDAPLELCDLAEAISMIFPHPSKNKNMYIHTHTYMCVCVYGKHNYNNNISLHVKNFKVPVNWYKSSSVNQLSCLLGSQK